MTRVAVTGAGGRMGREVLGAAADRPGVAVAVAVNRTEADPVGGLRVVADDDLAELLAANDADVLVDFTAPEGTLRYVEACAEAGVPAVVGTTGFDEEDLATLRSLAERTAVLRASNFSRGIAALRRALGEAVAALPDADVELTETHHNGKRDAPSGTARTLLADIEAARPDLEARTHGREGETPRRPEEIGVHARRAGDVTGEHEVLLAGADETLSLTHRAGDRGVFAAGALDAAEWLAGRDPGWYGFEEVI